MKTLAISALIAIVAFSHNAAPAQSPTMPLVEQVPKQPILAQVNRLRESMEVLGNPFEPDLVNRFDQLKLVDDEKQVAAAVQNLLDPLCLFAVETVNDGPPILHPGKTRGELMEQGWRTFLVKVVNRTGTTGRVQIESPNATPLPHSPQDKVDSRWMQLSQFEGQPMRPNLSGIGLEYRIVQIYSRDAGIKQALFDVFVSEDPATDQDLIRQWRFSENVDGWYTMNNAEVQTADGALRVVSTGEDPFIGAKVEAQPGTMVLRFWAMTKQEGIGQLFWWTKDRPSPSGDRHANFLLEPGKEHLYEIPFQCEGELAGIRLDPCMSKGEMRIDWIDLSSAERSSRWSSLPLEFESLKATPIHLTIRDEAGLPAFAKLEIRDSAGRIYPAQSKRLAPDLFFQRHVYRGNGESISLPPGDYSILCSRGPETIGVEKRISVKQKPIELSYVVQRWIDPSKRGWWSGDHHIHAAGCLHYENPTEGVKPEDMIRHIMGEDLKVGCCLTWGPCFDYQKRFFTGSVAQQSSYPYTLRYDVEVSGFGSHMSGHLNLLNLQQQIYPGGESKDHWPTLGLNTLRWAKKQGAVCGPAHSSIGLTRIVSRVPDTDGKDGPHRLPNYDVPAFDGIGANEFIVDVTHSVPGPDENLVPAVDFISAMNTDRVAEWNMWYHVLNCGFRVAVSGETDFPCISGERVGMGRVYAQVDGQLTFEKWIQSIADGRSYVSDGTVHLMNFEAANALTGGAPVRLGVDGSELTIGNDHSVRFTVQAAAKSNQQQPLEVELIVNGLPVSTQTIVADGVEKELLFETDISESSWVALRVFPNAHTNPIFVTVDEKAFQPIQDSVRWCLMGVDQCWQEKQPTYAAEEQADAKEAYDFARQTYQAMLDTVNDDENVTPESPEK